MENLCITDNVKYSSVNNEKKWIILIGISLVALMINIDFTAVNLAIAPISHQFGMGMNLTQWIINAYLLSMGMFFIISGRLGDIFGNKKFFILGVAIFGLSSLSIGLASNGYLLIIERFIQGIGASIAYPCTFSILFSVFDKDEITFSIGIVAAVSGLGQIVGPTFGGILIQWLGWNWIFYINVPIAIVTIIMILVYYKSSLIEKSKVHLDLIGTILLAFSFLCLVYGVNSLSNSSISSLYSLALIIAGIILGIIFIKVEKKIKFPLVDVSILKIKGVLSVNIIRTLLCLTFMSTMFILSLYFQNILNIDAIKSGILLISISLPFAIVCPISGKISDKIGEKKPMILGFIILTAGYVWLSCLSYVNMPIYWIIFPLILVGIGCGIGYPANTSLSIKCLPTKDSGLASGISYTNNSISGSIGIAIAGLIVSSIAYMSAKSFLFSSQLRDSSIKLLLPYADGTTQTSTLLTKYTHSQSKEIYNMAQHSFTLGLRWYFIVMVIVLIMCIILSIRHKQNGI